MSENTFVFLVCAFGTYYATGWGVSSWQWWVIVPVAVFVGVSILNLDIRDIPWLDRAYGVMVGWWDSVRDWGKRNGIWD